ncbi:MAG: SseB family protein [Pseudoruegeria sp.]
MTPLDTAHGQMMANAEDDAARLKFFERLADSEVFVLLEQEAEGQAIVPRLFEIPQGSFILIFDREDRLTEFAEGEAAYAGLSGRALCQMIAGQGYGLGLNLEVAPSSFLVPSEAVDWLVETLTHTPEETEDTPQDLSPPVGLPETLVVALDTKLATAQGLARMAYLAGVTYSSGRRSHILAFVDAIPGAETALAHATNEALTFSGIEAGQIDVAFFAATHPISATLARVGLRFDLPKLPEATSPSAPGMDPEKPPRLV